MLEEEEKSRVDRSICFSQAPTLSSVLTNRCAQGRPSGRSHSSSCVLLSVSFSEKRTRGSRQERKDGTVQTSSGDRQLELHFPCHQSITITISTAQPPRSYHHGEDTQEFPEPSPIRSLAAGSMQSPDFRGVGEYGLGGFLSGYDLADDCPFLPGSLVGGGRRGVGGRRKTLQRCGTDFRLCQDVCYTNG